MSEVAVSIINKNSLLYGTTIPQNNFGSACVERKGEEVRQKCFEKPAEAPLLAVREK